MAATDGGGGGGASQLLAVRLSEAGTVTLEDGTLLLRGLDGRVWQSGRAAGGKALVLGLHSTQGRTSLIDCVLGQVRRGAGSLGPLQCTASEARPGEACCPPPAKAVSAPAPHTQQPLPLPCLHLAPAGGLPPLPGPHAAHSVVDVPSVQLLARGPAARDPVPAAGAAARRPLRHPAAAP